MTDRKFGGPSTRARLAGLCYLATIAAGTFDHLVVGRGLIVAGDAAATARNILASEPAYRLAFALDLAPVYVVVTVLLYELLRPVSRSVSLLAAASSLVGGAVGSVIAVLKFAPLDILGGSDLQGFGTGQRQALALLSLDMHGVGFAISLVFYGFYCLLLGALVVSSRFMPKAVGLLLGAGGLGYMVYAFATFVAPGAAEGFSAYALSFGGLGEAALTLWLLIMGVDAAKWRVQAAAVGRRAG